MRTRFQRVQLHAQRLLQQDSSAICKYRKLPFKFWQHYKCLHYSTQFYSIIYFSLKTILTTLRKNVIIIYFCSEWVLVCRRVVHPALHSPDHRVREAGHPVSEVGPLPRAPGRSVSTFGTPCLVLLVFSDYHYQ